MSTTQAETLRDNGINQAIENAENKCSDWQKTALEYLNKYPLQRFMTEQLREWSHKNGLPKPPNPRAWGGVIKKAQSLGMVRHLGYLNTSNPKAHRTPASYWEKK